MDSEALRVNRCYWGSQWREIPSLVPLPAWVTSTSETEPIVLEYKAAEENPCLLKISIFWRTKLSYVWDLGCPLASAVSLSFGKLPCSMILMCCQSHSHTPPSTRKSSPPDSQESLEISAKLGAGASDPKSLIALLETFYRDLRHQDTQHPCLLLVSP